MMKNEVDKFTEVYIRHYRESYKALKKRNFSDSLPASSEAKEDNNKDFYIRTSLPNHLSDGVSYMIAQGLLQFASVIPRPNNGNTLTSIYPGGHVKPAATTYLPSPYPRSQFMYAKELCTHFNTLCDNLTCDPEWLIEQLEPIGFVDDFVNNMLNICKRVYIHGTKRINKDIRFHLLRSDYMTDVQQNPNYNQPQTQNTHNVNKQTPPEQQTPSSTHQQQITTQPSTNTNKKYNEEKKEANNNYNTQQSTENKHQKGVFTQTEKMNEKHAYTPPWTFHLKQIELNSVSISCHSYVDSLVPLHKVQLQKLMNIYGFNKDKNMYRNMESEEVEKKEEEQEKEKEKKKIISTYTPNEELFSLIQPPNTPLLNFGEAFYTANNLYKKRVNTQGPTVVLWLVSSSDLNEVDHRQLAFTLEHTYGLHVIRATFEELHKMKMCGVFYSQDIGNTEDNFGTSNEISSKGDFEEEVSVGSVDTFNGDDNHKFSEIKFPFNDTNQINNTSVTYAQGLSSPTNTETTPMSVDTTTQATNISSNIETQQIHTKAETNTKTDTQTRTKRETQKDTDTPTYQSHMYPYRLFIKENIGPWGGDFVNHEISIVYLRTGYAPTHFVNNNDWGIFELLEGSEAVKCPSVPTLLSGMKKIQQTWCKGGVLERFTEKPMLIKPCFAHQIDVNDTSQEANETKQHAINNYSDYVLKPQREGGGNNIHGLQLKQVLQGFEKTTYEYKEQHKTKTYQQQDTTTTNASPYTPSCTATDKQTKAFSTNTTTDKQFNDSHVTPQNTQTQTPPTSEYILMEKVRPPSLPTIHYKTPYPTHENPHPLTAMHCIPSVSEFGTYGTAVYDGSTQYINKYAGYLVRTKSTDADEGGFVTGVSSIDSVFLYDDFSPAIEQLFKPI